MDFFFITNIKTFKENKNAFLLLVNHERAIYTTRKTFINLKKILFILLLDHFLFAKFIEFCQQYNFAIFPLKCTYWLIEY